ncbi:MAG TPA: DUF4837 family protein [Candidatus Alistipes avicola]|uniref:DUF4837 family protein n=1 Tax=Candidatus Alistipes avicola TaxID=2838432 RepID=A0A9D2IAY1_9BACT|nr:DUF4837 family protein [uncultured Alistipes sp.]HJA98084.1 DUF4837 family protein [Candidatus Alistipes avicola]
MKKISVIALLFFWVLFLLPACKAFRSVSDTSRTAQGAPYELIVVCNQRLWEGEFGDTLRNVLQKPVPYLIEQEPHFQVMRIMDKDFKGLMADHRNVLKIVEDPSLPETHLSAQFNVTAAPQIVLTLQGPSEDALTQYISVNRDKLLETLEMAERNRSISFAERFNQPELSKLIREMFGVEMNVPKGYILAQQSDDFLWFRYEFPSASQGFMLYSYPYEGAGSLSEESLLAARNRFSSRIPGPTDGSFMTTAQAMPPLYKMFRQQDRLWVEMRGFWDVKGDFMGGPFVSYTTVDQATKRVFTLDCYIYSPKNPKRNYLREVEHLLYLVKFPIDSMPQDTSVE